jgi:GT2 family glycosyltransferase
VPNLNYIAVLMTCHNRKDTTIACLERLMSQKNTNNVKMKVYLVDDGSTDGTSNAVKKHFPDTIVLNGDGNLFWCGGMRLAFDAALKEKYDYYLWLNDDSMLFKNAVQTMIETSRYGQTKLGKTCIIVGSMQDSQTNKRTYGGSKKGRWWNPLAFEPIEPSDNPEDCDVFNGNCVLIPDIIARTIGNLNTEFTHGLGDYEYGIRAKKNGFHSLIAAGFIGTCSRNTLKNTCKDNDLSIRERIDQLSNLKVIPPADEYMKFIKINGGILWPFYWFKTLIRKIFPWLWVIIRSKVKNQ